MLNIYRYTIHVGIKIYTTYQVCNVSSGPPHESPSQMKSWGCYKRLTLGWVIDRCFTAIAQWVTPSHLASLAGHEFESRFERVFHGTLAQTSLKASLPGSPGIEAKRFGPRTAVYGTVTSQNIPPFRAGGLTI